MKFNLSFSLTSEQKINLESISHLRKDLLVKIISPRIELSLQSDALKQRIISNDNLQTASSTLVQTNDVINNLKTENIVSKQDIQKYSEYYKMIYTDWSGCDKQVNFANLPSVLRKELFSVQQEVEQLLQFVQVKNENSIIQAGIVYAGVFYILKESTNRLWLPSLLSYIFLCKDGFSIRNSICVEEYFAMRKSSYQQSLLLGLNDSNLTSWLEFYTNSVLYGLNQIEKRYVFYKNNLVNQVYLSKRDKEILQLLELAETRITNVDLQKKFKISQVTASRDLSRLNTLGLLKKCGGGRSIYYIKI